MPRSSCLGLRALVFVAWSSWLGLRGLVFVPWSSCLGLRALVLLHEVELYTMTGFCRLNPAGKLYIYI